MLATVLITNHDYADWLPRAVDSALDQTHPEVEVVVVDDGSTDRSRAVLRRYGDRITTVLQENRGQGAAVNAGFAASHGEVVCLLDSDDEFTREKVAGVVDALVPGVSVVHHPLQLVDTDGVPVGKPSPRRAVSGELAGPVTRSGGYWPWPASSGLSFARGYLDEVLPVPDLPVHRYPEAHRSGGVPFVFADAYLAGLAPFFGHVVGRQDVLALQRVHQRNTWTRATLTGVDDHALLRRRRERLEMELRVVHDALLVRGVSADLDPDRNVRIKQYRWAAGDGGSLAGVMWEAARCPVLPLSMKWRELARLALRRW